MALKKNTGSTATTKVSKKTGSKKSAKDDARKVEAELISDEDQIDSVEPEVDEDGFDLEPTSENQELVIVPAKETAVTSTQDPLTYT